MKTIKLLLTATALLTMVSCERRVFFRSYVAKYYAVNKIELTKWVLSAKKGIAIRYSQTGMTFLGSYFSTGREKTVYDNLCVKHNDMGYKRRLTINDSTETILYLGMDFVAIMVVSDSAFDEEHPAGADLGDIISYLCVSPKKYIDSGYRAEFDWDTYEGRAKKACSSYDLRASLHPIDKLVSELTIDDLVLLGPGKYDSQYLGCLVFETQPTLSKTHHFTVIMTIDDGKTLSASVDITF